MTAEVIDTASGEVIETITANEAWRLTAEAKTEFKSASDHFGKAWSLIEEAVKGGGHLALGYRSPGDYLHAEFDEVLARINVPDRRIAVRGMSAMGISTRAQAKVLGVSHTTVERDASGGTDVPPEPQPHASPGFAPGWRSASEVLDQHTQPKETAQTEKPMSAAAAEKPAKVVGIDGKTYSRSASKAEQERRLARLAEMAETGWSSPQIAKELGHTEEYVRRLARDNNITINADRVMGKTRRQVDHDRIASEIVTGLEGLALSLHLLDIDQVNPRHAAEWATSLNQSLRELSQFRNQIKNKEMAQ